MISIAGNPISPETSLAGPDSIETDTLEMLFKEARQRGRRRRLRRGALALVVVLAAGVVVGATYVAGGSPAHSPASVPPLTVGASPKVLTCQGTDVIRPRNYIVTCADAYTQLTNTHWSRWTSTSASGTTTFAMNLCKPYCAASKMTYYPKSVVSFTSPVATKHGSLFSMLTVRYESAGRSHVFHFSYRGDPSFAK
ncbi:MAG: hypothetical protein ACRDVC_07215 [Acidimicrobiales bacterium]